MPPRLILIGPMGCGKTTIGKIVAENLNLPFRDTDLLIEEEEKKSVSEIFLEDGEEKFRLLEKSVLRKELLSDETVLALGGGAPISMVAQSALRAIASPVVYLQISLANVAPRIGFNRDRPLLLHNPRGQWETLMQERRPIYEAIADTVIDVNGKEPDVIASEVLEFLT